MPFFLAMFPGQGSQFPKMSKELLDQFPRAVQIFEEAEDISGLPLREICSKEEEYSKLQQTLYQQPAILTHSFAVWSIIQEELGLSASFYAGHSLGEYTALVASGKLRFSDAVSLVCARARTMQETVFPGMGGMLAARTKDGELLSKLCFEAKENFGGVLEIVNYNSPDQYILSGHTRMLNDFLDVLKENKVLARKLDVSGPFHSSLMREARLRMTPLIEKVSFEDNENYIIANVTGKVAHPYEHEHLIAQIDHPVLWLDTLRSAFSAEVDTYIEFGPKKVLSSLVKKSVPGRVKIFDTDDLTKSLRTLEKEFAFSEFELQTKKSRDWAPQKR